MEELGPLKVCLPILDRKIGGSIWVTMPSGGSVIDDFEQFHLIWLVTGGWFTGSIGDLNNLPIGQHKTTTFEGPITQSQYLALDKRFQTVCVYCRGGGHVGPDL